MNTQSRIGIINGVIAIKSHRHLRIIFRAGDKGLGRGPGGWGSGWSRGWTGGEVAGVVRVVDNCKGAASAAVDAGLARAASGVADIFPAAVAEGTHEVGEAIIAK